MAAGSLSAPGTATGPCALGDNGQYMCSHKDCAHTYGMANHRCPECGERIGYGNRFFDVTPNEERGQRMVLVHEWCELERIHLEAHPPRTN